MKSNLNQLHEEQKLDMLFSEISSVEENGIQTEERSGMPMRYTREIIHTLEKLLDFNGQKVFTELILKKILRSLHTPVCLLTDNKKIVFYNGPWRKMVFDNSNKANSGRLLMDELINSIRDLNFRSLNQDSGVIQKTFSSEQYTMHVYPFNFNNRSSFFLLDLRKSSVKKPENDIPVDFVSGEKLFYGQKESDPYAWTILNAIDGFFFTLDNSGRILSISEKVAEKLGFMPGELMNVNFDTLMSMDQRSFFGKAFSTVLSGTEGFWKESKQVVEIELCKKNGTCNFFDMTLTPCERLGQLTIAGICIDVQQRKMKEEHLENARVRAQSSDRLKSDFLADMSHEIRTPLNGIIGFSSILDREDLNCEKREKYMRIIRSSSRQLLTLVNDIIDISKIEAGQLRMAYSDVNIKPVMEELYLEVQQEAIRMGKEKVIRIRKSLPRSSDDIIILTDEVRLKQIMINLINNALKFTKQGEIKFGYMLDAKARNIRFFVYDTGIGVSKENQQHIFDRFQQTGEGAKANYKGTGLGLAISRGIVEILGGEIGVVSENGKGTEFFFILPLEPPLLSDDHI